MASGTTYLTSDKTRLLTPHYFRGGNLPKVMQSTNTSNATFLTVNTPTGTFGFYVNANSSWAGLASQYGTNAVEYFAYFEINPEATYSRIQFQKKTLFKEDVSISKELTVDNSIFTHNGIYMYGSSTSNVTDSLYFTKTADAGGATLTNSGTEYSYPTGPNIFPVRIYGYPARWKITYTDGVETEKTIYDSPSLWINIKSVKSSDLTATGYNEYYYLSSTNDRTSSGNYRIHSTKYLITVGQGGTGSNTSAFQSGGIIYYNGSKMVSNANLTTSGSNITIKATYYPLIYLEALSTNGASTYTRGYLEAGYDDKLVLWCDSDKTTTSKSRRGLAVYGYANKSDSKYALALRQCDTTGAWQADQYILTNGNWNNWITLSSIGAAAASHTHTLASLGAAASNHTHTLASLGAAAASHTHTQVHLAAGNVSFSSTNTVALNGISCRWYSTTGLIPGQPSQWGFLVTIATGDSSSENHQFFIEQANGGVYHRGTNGSSYTSPPAFRRLWSSGDAVTNAVWNDLGECRKSFVREPGYAIAPSGTRTSTRLEPGARIISDTWGFLLGDEKDTKKAPVAISGRVLAYPLHDKSYYEIGDAVCAAEEGKIDKMTREEIMMYPDRILGIVNEIPDYDIWKPSLDGGRKPVYTNGRIWIDVR